MNEQRSMLALSDIVVDEDLQPRVTTDHNVSHEYGLAMARGDVFPPVDVFFDGADYWLADGFHRYYAAEALGLAEIECAVHVGTREDALWFTCGANAKNGLHRKRDDIQLAIERALKHPYSAGWTDGRLADHICCAPNTVKAVRERLISVAQIAQQNERVGKDGKTYRADANRGKAKDEHATEPETAEPRSIEPNPESSAHTQSDIEDVPGVKPPAKVVPLIDPKWEHLASHLRAVVGAHAHLPAPGVTAANFPECLAHSLSLEDVEAIARWWAGFVPLWRARQPEIQRYLARITANR